MLSANVKKVVAALRSGEYHQAKVSLHSYQGWCCLGVICDLYAQEHPIDRRIYHYGCDGCWVEIFGQRESIALPDEVQKWIGFRTSAGTWDDNGLKASLVGLNDGTPSWTFDQIADFIESEPEGLFITGVK